MSLILISGVLLFLAVQDYRTYRVSLWGLLLWIAFSLFSNWPLQYHVFNSLMLVFLMYMALKLLSFFRGKLLEMGIGDWLFLIGLALFYSPFELVLHTIISNLLGVIFILIRKHRTKHLGYNDIKAPMISFYTLVFLSNLFWEWSH